MDQLPFSSRNNYRGEPPEISIREDAPEQLRVTVIEAAKALGLSAGAFRTVVCRVLRVRPNTSGNWSPGNVWMEVEDLVYSCDWFKVYDLIETLYNELRSGDLETGQGGIGRAERFAEEINQTLIDNGIGWQIVEGMVVTRGEEAFEAAINVAKDALRESGRPTAAGHIYEALHALSRRPDPNLSGAIYHAMGALEAVARDITGEGKATLGGILKHHPDLVPPPLDTALEKMWGYASNEARHVAEGRTPTREDAELVVTVAAAVCTYLARRPKA